VSPRAAAKTLAGTVRGQTVVTEAAVAVTLAELLRTLETSLTADTERPPPRDG
jgi:hypothetical protein